MAARYEPTPTPNLPGYALGEKLGAGSYGRTLCQEILRMRLVLLGTVYKARLISVCVFLERLTRN